MRVFKRVLAGIVMLGLLAFPVLIYFNAQSLTDWWQLRGYSPPPTVSNLASQDAMTTYARHVFYVNRPDIRSNASQFRNDCNENEKTIVLGCYHSNQEGIFVYNVTDPRLSGIEQVTAAHEMLHAAYDRLSTHERNYVDGLLQDYYSHDLKDPRIIDTMDAYRQTEPNDLVNEMHSVFGTEIADLPAPLEAYYTKYFTNRHTVSSFAAVYQAEFTSRDNQVKADDAQLAQLKDQIKAKEQALNAQLAQINSDRATLNSLRSGGRIDEYNSSVAGFNDKVNAYNSGVDSLRSDINSYNQLVSVRNSIASELASLDQAIDTRLVPQSTQ